MLFGSKGQRIFAVGDIHGCAKELEALLRKIKLSNDDLIIFLGDYIDRGPDARRVVDLILELSSMRKVITLRGNHESLLLDFLDRPESQGSGLFVMNGGTSTLANYAESTGSFNFPEEHLKFFRGLRLFYETDDYFFVHAGVPEKPLSTLNPEKDEFTLLWTRQPFLSSQYDWGKTIVHGHTPVQAPDVKKNRINVDTGCVYDNCLTAIELPARKFHVVERMDKSLPRVYPRDLQSNRASHRFSGRLPVRASRPGDVIRNYETLNYNEVGLLMQEKIDPALKDVRGVSYLGVGEKINGEIGSEQSETTIRFEGTVVRTESRGPMVVYGIRIDTVEKM